MNPVFSGKAFWLTAACTALAVLVVLYPSAWTPNEIQYFDLSAWYLAPGNAPAQSAIFDHSHGRFLAQWIIGLAVRLLGHDGAFILLRLLTAGMLAVSYAFMATSLRVRPAAAILAIVFFLMWGQTFFAGEWIVKGVEAKVFAYAAVMAAIGLAWQRRWTGAAVAIGLAVWLHFLVGGFWGAALLLLHWQRERSARGLLRLGGLMALLSLPILAILVRENLLLTVETEGLDMSLREIYAVFRNPHHVAPFASPRRFVDDWLPGILHMMAFGGFIAIAARKIVRGDRLARWLLPLYGTLALALIAAFLDWHTHLLAPLYLFRPSSLALLLSLLAAGKWLEQALLDSRRGLLSLASLALLAGFVAPRGAEMGEDVIRHGLAAYPRVGETERAVLDEVARSTRPDGVVVIEPWADMGFPWVAFERLSGRPALVSFKFVPVHRGDMARWYRLERWRRSLFAGNCDRVGEQPVDYLLVRRPQTLEKVAPCGRLVWTIGRYSLVEL